MYLSEVGMKCWLRIIHAPCSKKNASGAHTRRTAVLYVYGDSVCTASIFGTCTYVYLPSALTIRGPDHLMSNLICDRNNYLRVSDFQRSSLMIPCHVLFILKNAPNAAVALINAITSPATGLFHTAGRPTSSLE